jgi:hypothetical protein
VNVSASHAEISEYSCKQSHHGAQFCTMLALFTRLQTGLHSQQNIKFMSEYIRISDQQNL